jgi:hypothetical protein
VKISWPHGESGNATGPTRRTAAVLLRFLRCGDRENDAKLRIGQAVGVLSLRPAVADHYGPEILRMPIFISHSFENRPEFENVTDALLISGVCRSGTRLKYVLARLCANNFGPR